MLKMTKRLSGFAAAIILMLSLASCSMAYGSSSSAPLVTNVESDSLSVLSSLQSASEVTAKKAVLSWGDRWTISADGVEIGEIRGQAIYALGDTYSLFSKSGNLVGSEGEAFRLVNHRADLFDFNNEKRGSIQENFSLLFADYSIKNVDDEIIGKARQKLSIIMNFNIEGAESSEIEYNISKAFFSIGSSVTIERKVANPSVEAIDALWLAVIASEVEDAKSD